MRYSSKLGCLLYYDNVVCHQCLCEPTMLFLFGLEAVITDISDYTMTVPVIDPNTKKPMIDPETGEVVTEEKPNEYNLKTLRFSREDVPELFDSIYRYLYHVPEQDPITVDTIEYDCNGMKLFLNNITGTKTDRVVPFIFHEDQDAVTLGLPDDADYNTIAKKIHDVFESAGYEAGEGSLPLLSTYHVYDKASLNIIDEYNKLLKEEHQLKKANAMIYKLLDYRAMYSYALGVLYGCECLGCDDNFIWRIEPSIWYDSDLDYQNLVSTAWDTFRFHYHHPIPRIDCDIKLVCKYKGKQSNKLWNFNNDEYNLKQDETLCTSLYIENGNEISLPIIYSQSTGPQKMPPGSYLIPGETEWKPLDSSVIDSITKKGIVADSDNTIIRYLANDEIHIDKAYKYSKGKFLSPSKHTVHFIHEGDLGWVDFIEDSYKRSSHDNPLLTLAPVGFDNIPSDLLALARDKETNDIVIYYHSYVTESNIESDRRSLYGILPGDVTVQSGIITVPDDTLFTQIVSDISFADKYEFPVEPDGYSLTPYYNLANQISIYVYDEDDTMMWNGNDTPVPIVEFGYTLTPSEQLDTYIDSPNDEPDEFDLRYNSDEQYGYWSNTWIPKQWKSSLDEDVYKKEENLISLYKNESLIAKLNTYDSLSDNSDEIYIFNNQQILSDLNHGFITLDDSYNIGITTYPCDIIYYDEFGNSLLDDEGNPLVWYDAENDLYWNCTFDINEWQSEIPSMLTKFIYNSSTDEMKQVNVDDNTGQIYIDGDVISLDDFYNTYPSCGIICDNVNVFNPHHLEYGILYCYVDTYVNKYCIPTKTNWVSRSDISSEGYRFVDGITTVFAGNTGIDVVYDTDSTD